MIDKDKETELLFNGAVKLLIMIPGFERDGGDRYEANIGWAVDTAQNILSAIEYQPTEG